MGEQVDRLPVQGIAVPSEYVSLEMLRGPDEDAPASSYSQAGGAAGDVVIDDPTSHLELELTGGQVEPIDVTVVRAGLPGQDGIGVVYRLRSEAADDEHDEWWRGRAEPSVAIDAWPLLRASGDAYEHFDLVSPAGSRGLVALYAEVDTGSRRLYATTVDESTTEWGTAVIASADELADNGAWQTGQRACTAVALPDGELLAIAQRGSGVITAFRSLDGGATWGPYSRDGGQLVSATTHTRFRSAYARGGIALFASTANELYQYASADLGVSFRPVWQSGASFTRPFRGGRFDACARPDGSIAVIYLRHADGHPCVRILASAGQPFDQASDSVVVAGERESVAIACDDTGALYAVLAEGAQLQVYLFTGSGWAHLGANAFWTRPAIDHFDDDNLVITNLAAAWSKGRLAVAYQWGEPDEFGAVVVVGHVQVAVLGGWSNLLPAQVSEDVSAPRLARWTWLFAQSAIALPSEQGWTAGGTVTATIEDPGVLQWICSASNGFYAADGGAGDPIAFEGACRLTGSPSTASLTHGILARLADGVTDRSVEVRIGATQLLVVDGYAATTLATVDLAAGAQWVHVRVYLPLQGVAVWYRTSASSVWRVAWVQTAPLTAKGSSPAATSAIAWGFVGAGTGTARWRHWALDDDAISVRMGLGTRATGQDPLRSGGLLSTYGSALPDVGTDERAALLSARRGPGRRGETASISPVYAYGLAQALPQLGESPDRGWRSVDKAEQILVFDLGADGVLGLDWLRLFAMLRLRQRLAYLESSANGSDWTTRDAFDAATGFTGLKYLRLGRLVRPSASFTAAARPLYKGELVGGYIVFDDTYARPVVANSAGVWAPPPIAGATKYAEVEIGGDPDPIGTDGDCYLVFPDAVHVGRYADSAAGAPSNIDDRYWRVRIPANQLTPWAAYQVGKLFVGNVTVFGKRASRGWNWTIEPNSSRSVSRYGTIRRRQDGPPARRWTWGWADGEQRRRHAAGLSDVDYVRPGSTGPALAMRDDVWGQLWGLLDGTRSGEVPVIALAAIPPTDQTITDRTLWLYGSLAGGPSFGQIDGREGYDARGRIDPITIDEIR